MNFGKKKSDLRATALLGTVHTFVARRACAGAAPKSIAGELDIF